MKFYENQNVKRRVQLCSKLKIKLKKKRERSERNRVWIELCTKPTKIKWKLNLLNTGGREIDVHSQYPYVLRHCLIKKGLNFLLQRMRSKVRSSRASPMDASVFYSRDLCYVIEVDLCYRMDLQCIIYSRTQTNIIFYLSVFKGEIAYIYILFYKYRNRYTLK